jgi:hypothetical protein
MADYEAELRRMSPAERARLARALADFDLASLAPDPGMRRRERLLTLAALGAVFVLAVWIGVLAVVLPRHFRVGGWRLAWVGFDLGLLCVFAATAWAAWRKRQMLVPCLVVLATLLACDAWFDTSLDFHTRGFLISLLTAVFIELPLAAVALALARRLLRVSLRWLETLEGVDAPKPAFWRVPLYYNDALSYRDLLRQPARPVEEPTGGRSGRDG